MRAMKILTPYEQGTKMHNKTAHPTAGKRKKIKGKTCYWFKKLESQSELDRILDEDLYWWVQYMKDAGAWEE